MARHFNTAGPCNPEIHYMLPSERRLPRVRDAVESQSYFVLHAPRQVGKTTSLMGFARELTAEGRFAALMVSMEMGAGFPRDLGAAEKAILGGWRGRSTHALPAELRPPPWPDAEAGARIHAALQAWAEACPRPLVVFLDEIDALEGEVLVSVLRQLRDGHASRPESFPWSLALVGLRDVRDYKLDSGGVDRAHSSSPFNIKVESFTMRDFNADEVGELYAQHTSDTGQRFEEAAVARAFELTRGQPWLVNALARQAVDVLVRDRAVAVTAADVDRAKDLLVERQDTHLDSLAERLREPRVRAIIDPMLAGAALPELPPDDLRFAKDLGLVRENPDGSVEVANPIYREIVARTLAFAMRVSLPQIAPTWLADDGRLDRAALLEAFVAFWMQHGEVMTDKASYRESAAHLVLMAFLHRVVNGGGRIDREYAAGTGRLDLRVEFRGEALAIEVKTWRTTDKVKDPLVGGLVQLDAYMARVGVEHGWLVLFDQRATATTLEERASVERVTTAGGRDVAVVRL